MWEKEWWQSAHVCSLYTVWSICILLLSLLPPNPIRKYCAIVQNMSITPTRGGPFKKLQKQYLCNLVVENPLLYPIWKLFMSPFIYTISGKGPSVCLSGLTFLPHWGTWGLGLSLCNPLSHIKQPYLSNLGLFLQRLALKRVGICVQAFWVMIKNRHYYISPKDDLPTPAHLG